MFNKNQLKILVADDDDAVRLALVTVLQSEGYTTVEAIDGAEAIDVFEKEHPDIVLLGTVMPQINGYEVCRYIRTKNPDIHTLPILIITVMDDHASLQNAHEAGASDYLTKPIHWPLLMYRLNVLFKQKKLQTEREKIEARLRHTNKLSAIRQLTGGFAHDFNNILASQLGYTELALNLCDDANEEKLKTYLGEVQKASLRGKILIEQLMSFAMEEIDLNSVSMISDVFRESVKSLSKTIPARIKFETFVDVDNGWIPLDFVQFHEIIMNLLENAIDAIDSDGSITISLRNEIIKEEYCSSCLEKFSGYYLSLTCEDSGKGIDEEIQARIFEPFYSTKPIGKGTGHGMSVIHGIIHAAGGHVRVESTPGEGSVIRVLFKPVTGEAEKIA